MDYLREHFLYNVVRIEPLFTANKKNFGLRVEIQLEDRRTTQGLILSPNDIQRMKRFEMYPEYENFVKNLKYFHFVEYFDSSIYYYLEEERPILVEKDLKTDWSYNIEKVWNYYGETYFIKFTDTDSKVKYFSVSREDSQNYKNYNDEYLGATSFEISENYIFCFGECVC